MEGYIMSTPCENCITYAACKSQVLSHMSGSDDNHTAHIAMVYSLVLMPKCHLIKEYLDTKPSGYSTASIDTMIGCELHKIFNIPNFKVYEYIRHMRLKGKTNDK